MQLNLHNVLSITAGEPKSRELADDDHRYLVRTIVVKMRDSRGEHIATIDLFSADLSERTRDGKPPSLLLESEERMTEPALGGIDPGGDGRPF